MAGDRKISDGPHFAGTDRFVVQERLGAGGMGIVYRVYDRERRATVALKTLRKVDADSVYRFKREFRSLADIRHRNLVPLHELLYQDGRWILTMELLEGADFLTYVRQSQLHLGGDDTGTVPTATVRNALPDETSRTADLRMPPARRPWIDPERLRTGLVQLGHGVAALHAHGHVHGDIKPSNILVTRDEGRVVLLDFGVISTLGDRRGGGVLGTPSHMAPEQLEGATTPASDWYSVGVVMYEALTGKRPFRGSAAAILEAKQHQLPRPIVAPPDGVDQDVVSLCLELLQINPAERPGGKEILARLERHGAAVRKPVETPGRSAGDSSFIGRNKQLDALWAAHAEANGGVGSTVYVWGRSGSGKTALVERFLDELRQTTNTVVVTGRCYERESVPFKAVDSLIDSLCRYLLELPPSEADALMPRDVRILARIFPVLNRVEAVAGAQRRPQDPDDPVELQRRGFLALRELFGRLAVRGPLLLFIDDLQWGDVDSAPLLDVITRPPDAPEMLLVACCREEDRESSPLLRALQRRHVRLGSAAQVRHVEVDRLAPSECRQLAAALLSEMGADDTAADSIADEAAGSPYFVHELVRYALSGVRDATRRTTLSLGEVIRERVSLQDDHARRLLEVVAIAGQAVERRLVDAASRLDPTAVRDVESLFEGLEAERLIRRSVARDRELVEAYHDSIRETVTGSMDEPTRQARHRDIAAALEETPDPDPELLFVHYAGAGDDAAAADYAAAAARNASDALAFDRSAELYRFAIAHTAPTHLVRSLEVSLGNVLANAGLSEQAADAYLRACEGSTAEEALDLRREAGLQFMRAGNVERGLRTLREVAADVRLGWPEGNRRVLAAILYQRFRLWLHGLRFEEKSAEDVGRRKLLQIDVCTATAAGTAMVDTFLGAKFQAQSLLLALRAGEPHRVARALAFEPSFAAGRRDLRRVRAIGDLAHTLATRHGDDPRLGALIDGGLGLADYFAGNFREARNKLTRSTDAFRSSTGTDWEKASAGLFLMWSLYYLGELPELRERVEGLLDDAARRGDRYSLAIARIGIPNAVWLMADEPGTAEREARDAIETWPSVGFHTQHWWHLFSEVQRDLYVGDGVAARARMVESWRRLRRSLLPRQFHIVRVESIHLRARAALCEAARSPTRTSLVRAAERDAGRIARNGALGLANGFAPLLRAGAAALRADNRTAIQLLAEAEAAFREHGMSMHCAAASRCRGVLSGGDHGAELVTAADSWMNSHGIAAPLRFTAMLAPGFDKAAES